MGIRLNHDQAWDLVAHAHTGILTTLRRDGWPVSLPVWFVALDEAIYLRTPPRAKKVDRIQRDGRASFCVEAGAQWVELKAVVAIGTASIVEDDAMKRRALTALDAKYEAYGIPVDRIPEATKRHYGDLSTVVRFQPSGACLSWDNSLLRLTEDSRPHD